MIPGFLQKFSPAPLGETGRCWDHRGSVIKRVHANFILYGILTLQEYIVTFCLAIVTNWQVLRSHPWLFVTRCEVSYLWSWHPSVVWTSLSSLGLSLSTFCGIRCLSVWNSLNWKNFHLKTVYHENIHLHHCILGRWCHNNYLCFTNLHFCLLWWQ